MLQIRPEQILVFEQAAAEHFAPRLEQHALDALPGYAAALGENALRAAVREGIRQAAGRGFSTQAPVRLFVELSLLLGSAFHSDPQFPWASAVLDSPFYADELARARRLHDAAMAYLDQVHGPDDTQRNAALERWLKEPIEIKADTDDKNRSRERFRSTVLVRLEHLWPEKYAWLGEDATQQRLQQWIKDAVGHGLKKEKGVYIYICLGYLLGSGFDRDPLYPWAGAVLGDTATDQTERAERLHQTALKTLASLDSGGFRPARPNDSAIQGHPYEHPLADPALRAALRRAWQDSLADDPQQRHQEGGYIVQQPNGAFAVERWPRGGRGGITPLPLDNEGLFNGTPVIGEFRTQPNPAVDEQGRKWLQGAQPHDVATLEQEPYRGDSYLIGRDQIWRIPPKAGLDAGQAGPCGSREEVLG